MIQQSSRKEHGSQQDQEILTGIPRGELNPQIGCMGKNETRAKLK